MKSLRRRISRKISTLLTSPSINDKSIKAALAPPELDIPEYFQPNMVQSSLPKYYVSQQGPAKITILTETPDSPGFVTLVVYLQAGSRVESSISSGYAHWLRSSVFNSLSHHPKVFANTSVEFEREFLVVKTVCMSYQVDEFLDIIAEAIGPDALSQLVLENLEEESDQFFEPKECFLQTAFDYNGLGNPIKGGTNYLDHPDEFAESARSLHRKVLNSDNIVIAATGIYNRPAFHELVVDKFTYLEMPGPDSVTLSGRAEQSAPVFLGGTGFADLNEACQSPQMENDVSPYEPQLVLGFKGVSAKDPQFVTSLVLEALIGEASMFSVGGPGKNSFARAHNIMAHFHKFESVTCFNDHYQDT